MVRLGRIRPLKIWNFKLVAGGGADAFLDRQLLLSAFQKVAATATSPYLYCLLCSCVYSLAISDPADDLSAS